MDRKYTCLLFGEGGTDKNFLIDLTMLAKFKFHTKKWVLSYDNSHGCSEIDVIKKCKQSYTGKDYDLVICFIDLDVLKRMFPKKWTKKKAEIEKFDKNIHVFWHNDNLEDEQRKALGEKTTSKGKMHKYSKNRITEFINTPYWTQLKKIIKDKESELDADNLVNN